MEKEVSKDLLDAEDEDHLFVNLSHVQVHLDNWRL